MMIWMWKRPCWRLTASAALVLLLSVNVLLSRAAAKGSGQKADASGFVPLFNGEDLGGWQLRRAHRRGFVVEDGVLVCPVGSRGYLFTEQQYDDFVLQFEFRLTKGANSGVAIRSPLIDRKPAYQGIEIQILDNPRFRGKLRPTQYHGSIYDVVPARQGALKPVGQWNQQEIVCQGRRIMVKLNGQVILNANLDNIDHEELRKPHPGLNRTSGYIGLLGHGDRVEFRQIRIKELGKVRGAAQPRP